MVLLDHMADMFNFLRTLYIVFHSGYTSLHSHKQCTRIPVFPNSHQHLLLVLFLMVIIIIGVKWNLNVVLICISFMARDGDPFSHVFLAFGLLV
jgi:hypothetical protein